MEQEENSQVEPEIEKYIKKEEDADFIDLIKQMLRLNPLERITASKVDDLIFHSIIFFHSKN